MMLLGSKGYKPTDFQHKKATVSITVAFTILNDYAIPFSFFTACVNLGTISNASPTIP